MVDQEDGAKRDGGAPLEGVRTSIRRTISTAANVLTPNSKSDAASTEGSQDAEADSQGTSADSTLFRGAGQHATAVQTPEERILVVLKKHGGQLDQCGIVNMVEWSEATVSRSLSDLEETGEIARYQVGRGKIVVLDGVEPNIDESRMGRDR